MTSVPNETPTPPSMVTHIGNVQRARAYQAAIVPDEELTWEEAHARLGEAEGLLYSTLQAYDALSARLSWLAAEHAECMERQE